MCSFTVDTNESTRGYTVSCNECGKSVEWSCDNMARAGGAFAVIDIMEGNCERVDDDW